MQIFTIIARQTDGFCGYPFIDILCDESRTLF